MSDSGAILLEAEQLGCSLEGRLLWQQVSFRLKPGDRLGIAGPTGSGKTVLMRTLAGLTPLQEGRILLLGRKLSDWPMPDFRSHVVYLAQRPSLPEGTVQAALEAPFRFRVHRHQPFPGERLALYLEVLELEHDFLARRTDTLSGGESQLAAALRALLVSPRVLLLDEPTASLDAAAASRLEALVNHWRGDADRRAYLWTSHDGAQLQRMSDHILGLDRMQRQSRA